MAPDRARIRITDLAGTQLASGGSYHQFQPLTKRGNNDIGSGFNGDSLWLVLGVAAYLKEQVTSRSSTSQRPTTTPPAARQRSTSIFSVRCATPSGGSARTPCRSSGGLTGTTA